VIVRKTVETAAKDALKRILYNDYYSAYKVLISEPEFEAWIDRMQLLVNQVDLYGYVPCGTAAIEFIAQGACVYADKRLEKIGYSIKIVQKPEHLVKKHYSPEM